MFKYNSVTQFSFRLRSTLEKRSRSSYPEENQECWDEKNWEYASASRIFDTRQASIWLMIFLFASAHCLIFTESIFDAIIIVHTFLSHTSQTSCFFFVCDIQSQTLASTIYITPIAKLWTISFHSARSSKVVRFIFVCAGTNPCQQNGEKPNDACVEVVHCGKEVFLVFDREIHHSFPYNQRHQSREVWSISNRCTECRQLTRLGSWYRPLQDPLPVEIPIHCTCTTKIWQ